MIKLELQYGKATVKIEFESNDALVLIADIEKRTKLFDSLSQLLAVLPTFLSAPTLYDEEKKQKPAKEKTAT